MSVSAPPLFPSTFLFSPVFPLAVYLGHSHMLHTSFSSLLCIVYPTLRDFFMTKLVQLKRYALTPVVDLINHQSGVESDVSYNYFYGYFAVTTQVSSCW